MTLPGILHEWFQNFCFREKQCHCKEMDTGRFVFPKDHNKLCFKPLWCKTYKWLAYSKSFNGVYCVTCVLFGKEISQLNVSKLSAFYKEPFYDCKHAIQRFKRHASSAIHKNADVDLMHFTNIKICHKDVSINQQLNKILKYIIKMSRLTNN